MSYEKALVRIREKWPAREIFNRCVSVSNDLGKILQEEFPDSEVFTSRSDNLDGGRIRFFANHQVSVIKENGTGFVAFDVTRPFYEEGQEYWMLRADSKDELMKKLGEHYTGDWKINQRYNPRTSGYSEITEEEEK